DRQIRAPAGQRLLVVAAEGLESTLEHPLRFFLELRDVADDVLVQTALGGQSLVVFVTPTVCVLREALVLGIRVDDPIACVSHRGPPCGRSVLWRSGLVRSEGGMW